MKFGDGRKGNYNFYMKKHDVTYGEIKNRFYRHLELEHNNQIFFSGKYGTGKSTFLNNFFKEKNDEFYRIHLSPVNYVVTSNENIFDLIKVDIIRQLYNDNEIKESKTKRKKIVSSIKNLVKKDPINLTKYVLKSISKLHPIAEVGLSASEGVSGLIQELKKYDDEINSEQKTENLLMDFAFTIYNNSGTHIENDIITRIVQKKIEDINQKRKSVLIIDDLDRLDPEHIFRILNILSSHDNHNEKSHKFNFSKVILVADIDNIHKIFKHRYGEETDFEGYIDKFYSHEIFKYSNDDALISHIENINIQLRQEEKALLILLLKLFIKHQNITLRKIIKYKNYKQPDAFKAIEIIGKNHSINSSYISNYLWIDSDDMPVLYLIPILTGIFGSLKNLKEAINKIENDHDFCDFANIESLKYALKSFIFFDRYLQTFNTDGILFFFDYNYDEHLKQNRYNTESKIIRGEILKTPYTINRLWGINNPYRSQKSFFYDCSISIDIKSERVQNSAFVIMTKYLIDFIEKNNFKTKLNITS